MNLWAAVKNNRAISLLLTTYDEFSADNGRLLAAAVAYTLLFSLFPFALALFSIVGFLMSEEEVESQVITALGTLIPVARNLIVTTLDGVIRARGATGIIALLIFIWSALSFFDALRNALNRAWGVPSSQTFVKGQIMNISMLVLAIIALLTFTWLTTTVQYMHESQMQLWVFKFTRTSLFAKLVFMLLSGILAYGVILFLYHFIPSIRPRWRHIWLGALLATIGFEIVRFAFVWYVKNFAQYNLVYGPISSVIVLLMFIYLTAYVLLFFAKFSYVKMQREGKPIRQPGPPAVEQPS
ncbi:MAG: YihY/virulence factor BrkB family protein [Dehalococcoidia bacterium]|nr:YihY/virulence factor BrkB family protein [Dehalococcoidia bacterium]